MKPIEDRNQVAMDIIGRLVALDPRWADHMQIGSWKRDLVCVIAEVISERTTKA